MERVTLFRYRRVYCSVKGFGDGDVNPDLDRKVSLV